MADSSYQGRRYNAQHGSKPTARRATARHDAAQHAGHQQQASQHPRANQHAKGNQHAASHQAQGKQGGYTPSRNNPYMQPMATYGSAQRNQKQRRRPKHTGIIALVVVLVLVGAGVFLWFNPPFYTITVNGERYTVDFGTTIQTVIDKGYANPKPGNLLAVDKSLCKEGKGQPFVAKINGGEKTSDPKTRLGRDAVVEIKDGGDLVEEYTETTETIPHGNADGEATFNNYYNGAIHVYSDGEDGEKSVKTGKVSGLTVEEITKQPIDSGFHYFDANVGDEKIVALTFDDGPSEYTQKVLDVLAQYNVKATFFQVGENVEENPELTRAVHEAGHEIGTHTYDHAAGSGQGVNLTYMSADEQVKEVTKGYDAIEKALGSKTSHILRAPGGNYYGSLVKTVHPYVDAEFGWDIDTMDWSKPGASAIAATVKAEIRPGAIILCHDGGGNREQTVEALKEFIPYLQDKGYTFVTCSELLKYGQPAKS